MTRGRVGRIIRSWRTGTDFSATPKAPSWPATTMTRTAPTYCGILNLCSAVLPRVQGKGAVEEDDRREAPLLFLGARARAFLVAAQGQQARQVGAVGLGHVVKEVPGEDAQGFAVVEALAQVGSG